MQNLSIPFHTVLEGIAGYGFLHFVGRVGWPLDQGFRCVIATVVNICLKSQHFNAFLFGVKVFVRIYTVSVYSLVSLSIAQKNFKANDLLLFIMENLDFFPLPDCQDSFVMSVLECEFSPLGTEEVDIASVMLQRMM